MHGRTEIPVQRIEGLVVQRLDKALSIDLPKAYSRDSIPSRRNQIPTPETARKWSHFQRIQNEIPPIQKNVDIGVLIGATVLRRLNHKRLSSEMMTTHKRCEPYSDGE